MICYFAGILDYSPGSDSQHIGASLRQPLPRPDSFRQQVPSSLSSRPSDAILQNRHVPQDSYWQSTSPTQPNINGRPRQPVADFPDFNQLPAGQRTILKAFLSLGVRNRIVDFSGLPRCPSWLLTAESEPLPPPPANPKPDLLPMSHSQQLRDLERRHSQASQQMSDLERQHSRASQSSSMFPQGSYNSFSAMPTDSSRPAASHLQTQGS